MTENDNISLPILILHLPISLAFMVITRLHGIPGHAPNIRVGNVHHLICLCYEKLGKKVSLNQFPFPPKNIYIYIYINL